MPTQPCYCAALRRATRRMTALYDAALAPHGITLAQFSLLRNIRRHGPISLTDLAAIMDLDRSTIGRNIRVLIKSGWVEAAESPDQREASVTLSPKGQAILTTAEPDWTATQTLIETKLGPSGATALLQMIANL